MCSWLSFFFCFFWGVVGSTERVSEAEMLNRGYLDMLIERSWRLIISI